LVTKGGRNEGRTAEKNSRNKRGGIDQGQRRK